MSKAANGSLMAFIRGHVNDPHTQSDPCVLWPFGVKSKGYGQIDGRTAHAALLELRDGPAPEGKPLALHGRCNDRLCIIHSRWGSAAENAADRLRDGTVNRGAEQHLAKLTEADVRTIRVMLTDGVRGTTVAEWFRVSPQSISAIKSGRTWGWLNA